MRVLFVGRMQPFRAPSTSAAAVRRDASSMKGGIGGERRVPSSSSAAPGMGRRIVSQGLARTQQRTGELEGTPPAALQVDNTSFEEWMKMATDNKINATNTWSFALIDYFHDMSLLRSDSGDGSINFQKASCTLDGCVKVWTSRVDSVMAETGRLLSGLQDEDASSPHADTSQDMGDHSRVDELEGDERPRTKRRQRAQEATLAKSFSQLQVKRFDLEFTVDPLFKKTSADFDEDGAGGLLMNHLHVDDQMKVVFDASDAAATTEEDVDAQDPSDRVITEELDSWDLEKLRARMYAAAAQLDPSVRSIQSEPLSALLEDRMICPSTSTFTFAVDNDAALPSMQLDPEEEAIDIQDVGQDGLDFFDGQVGELDEDDEEERGAFVALTHDAKTTADDHDRLFDYFDNTKNWAGPEHWKMTRLHMSLATPALEKPAEAAPDKTAKARRTKESQVIDFLSADPPPPAKDLFEPSATPSAITLSKASQSATDRHLLPEDHHFNSKRLLRLFLKPKAQILLQRKRQRATTPGGLGGAWDDDDLAWGADSAPTADENAVFDTGLFEEHDPYEDVLAAPTLEAEAGGTDAFDVDSDIDEEAWGAEALRRVRPEFVDHARRAKQVDVKKLKDNIWQSLSLNGNESKPFSHALEGLQSMYAPSKFSEISTSFCFICLLHLANEEGLEVQVPTSEEPASASAILSAARTGNTKQVDDEMHVGHLERLCIRRDPAVPVA